MNTYKFRQKYILKDCIASAGCRCGVAGLHEGAFLVTYWVLLRRFAGFIGSVVECAGKYGMYRQLLEELRDVHS